MRKLMITAMVIFAVGCFSAAGSAYSGGCNDCKPKCESKCNTCKQDTCNKCETKCKPKCNTCQYPAWDVPFHPYQNCFTGSGQMCDQGCGGGPLPCKRACITCETISRKVVSTDPCTGCNSVCYVHETVYTELQRPTVVPWWFQASEGLAPVNVYSDNDGEEAADEG